MSKPSWAMKGELVLSCNCTVFCPCVLSLGNHPPTEGYCQTWAGFRIDAGHFGEVDLSGLNLGLIMEIPGYMSRGNWTAGLFIDKRASVYAVKALTKIFTGKAGGTTSLLSILVGKFLGVEQVPITYETRDRTRVFQIPKIIDGAVGDQIGNAGRHGTCDAGHEAHASGKNESKVPDDHSISPVGLIAHTVQATVRLLDIMP